METGRRKRLSPSIRFPIDCVRRISVETTRILDEGRCTENFVPPTDAKKEYFDHRTFRDSDDRQKSSLEFSLPTVDKSGAIVSIRIVHENGIDFGDRDNDNTSSHPVDSVPGSKSARIGRSDSFLKRLVKSSRDNIGVSCEKLVRNIRKSPRAIRRKLFASRSTDSLDKEFAGCRRVEDRQEGKPIPPTRSKRSGEPKSTLPFAARKIESRSLSRNERDGRESFASSRSVSVEDVEELIRSEDNYRLIEARATGKRENRRICDVQEDEGVKTKRSVPRGGRKSLRIDLADFPNTDNSEGSSSDSPTDSRPVFDAPSRIHRRSIDRSQKSALLEVDRQADLDQRVTIESPARENRDRSPRDKKLKFSPPPDDRQSGSSPGVQRSSAIADTSDSPGSRDNASLAARLDDRHRRPRAHCIDDCRARSTRSREPRRHSSDRQIKYRDDGAPAKCRIAIFADTTKPESPEKHPRHSRPAVDEAEAKRSDRSSPEAGLVAAADRRLSSGLEPRASEVERNRPEKCSKPAKSSAIGESENFAVRQNFTGGSGLSSASAGSPEPSAPEVERSSLGLRGDQVSRASNSKPVDRKSVKSSPISSVASSAARLGLLLVSSGGSLAPGSPEAERCRLGERAEEAPRASNSKPAESSSVGEAANFADRRNFAGGSGPEIGERENAEVLARADTDRCPTVTSVLAIDEPIGESQSAVNGLDDDSVGLGATKSGDKATEPRRKREASSKTPVPGVGRSRDGNKPRRSDSSRLDRNESTSRKKDPSSRCSRPNTGAIGRSRVRDTNMKLAVRIVRIREKLIFGFSAFAILFTLLLVMDLQMDLGYSGHHLVPSHGRVRMGDEPNRDTVYNNFRRKFLQRVNGSKELSGLENSPATQVVKETEGYAPGSGDAAKTEKVEVHDDFSDLLEYVVNGDGVNPETGVVRISGEDYTDNPTLGSLKRIAPR